MVISLTTIAVGAAIGAVAGIVSAIINHIKNTSERAGKTREEVSEKMREQVSFSETDEKYIEETQQLLKDVFGEDALERYRNATKYERIQMMHEFADQLSKLYGLNIPIDINFEEPKNGSFTFGFYSWVDKKAEFNIYLLTLKPEDFTDPKYFDDVFYKTLETIIHELRHAVQHRTVSEQGFWNIDEERRNKWANNMAGDNYIRPEINMIGYQLQPVEADANVFADDCMKGMRPE